MESRVGTGEQRWKIVRQQHEFDRSCEANEESGEGVGKWSAGCEPRPWMRPARGIRKEMRTRERKWRIKRGKDMIKDVKQLHIPQPRKKMPW